MKSIPRGLIIAWLSTLLICGLWTITSCSVDGVTGSGSCGSGNIYWDGNVQRCRDRESGRFVKSSCCGRAPEQITPNETPEGAAGETLRTPDTYPASMWNEPSSKDLESLPMLYENEETPLEDKIIHMHFFIGGSDWFAAEYSPKDRLFFGYAILNNDHQNAEWGYFSLDELISIRTQNGIEIDRDLYWTPKKAREING